MIIKRRVSREFVQIANDLVRDRTLALDAHGMLHYLLSLPDNWEIKLRQIENYWSIGPTKRQRIFRELADAGWLQYEKLKDDEGNYAGARWIVCDEPGPRPAAQDLDDMTEDGKPLAATKPDAPESQAPASASQGDGQAPHPADGSPGRRKTRPAENLVVDSRRPTVEEHRDSTNTTADAARDEDDTGEPPPLYAHVLRLWPADNVASSFACEKAFERLSPWLRKLAREGIAPYLADCRSKGQNRLCDLRTYLDERRWEKYTSRGGTTGAIRYAVKRGTPQAARWRAWLAENDPNRCKLFDMLMASSGAYTAPAEWPPPKDATAA